MHRSAMWKMWQRLLILSVLVGFLIMLSLSQQVQAMFEECSTCDGNLVSCNNQCRNGRDDCFRSGGSEATCNAQYEFCFEHCRAPWSSCNNTCTGPGGGGGGGGGCGVGRTPCERRCSIDRDFCLDNYDTVSACIEDYRACMNDCCP